MQRLHGLKLPKLGFRTLYLDWQAFDSYEDILAARTIDWKPEPPPMLLPHSMSCSRTRP